MKQILSRLGPTVAALGAMGLFVASPALAGADRLRRKGQVATPQ